jgi:hypothetical protein
MKRLLHNKKGTAEVIGTVLFIVILLFFFTNVYLWHDAAIKEMNQEYLNKINSPITVTIQDSALIVTNKGGVDTKLAMVWIIEGNQAGTGPDYQHTPIENSQPVPAGKSIPITIPSPTKSVIYTYKVITVNGNSATCTLDLR